MKFDNPKSMETHQKSNHRKFSETSKGFYKCDVCGEQFFNQVSFVRDWISHLRNQNKTAKAFFISEKL